MHIDRSLCTANLVLFRFKSLANLGILLRAGFATWSTRDRLSLGFGCSHRAAVLPALLHIQNKSSREGHKVHHACGADDGQTPWPDGLLGRDIQHATAKLCHGRRESERPEAPTRFVA